MSHRDVMARLVNEHGWRRGAELGLASGKLFGRLLRDCPSIEFLIGVDRAALPDRIRKVRRLAAEHRGRCIVMECLTCEAADRVQPATLDFVFIDADHHYHAVADDIARWRPKLRPGGWLTGHDFNRERFPGVIQAVDEVFGSRVQLFDWHVWAVAC